MSTETLELTPAELPNPPLATFAEHDRESSELLQYRIPVWGSQWATDPPATVAHPYLNGAVLAVLVAFGKGGPTV